MEKQDFQFVKEKTYQYELVGLKKIWSILFLCYGFYYLAKYFVVIFYQQFISNNVNNFDNFNNNNLGIINNLLGIPLVILNILSLFYIVMKLVSLKSVFYPEARFLTQPMIERITFFLIIIASIPRILGVLSVLAGAPSYAVLGSKNPNFYIWQIITFPTLNLSIVLLFNFFIMKEFYDSKLIKEFWQSSLILFIYPLIQFFVLLVMPSLIDGYPTGFALTTSWDPLGYILSVLLFILALIMYKRKNEHLKING